MLYIAVVIAALLAVVLQTILYRKKGFEKLSYSAGFSSGEVFSGDDVYLFEEIENRGRLPLPYVKIETELPEGLVFTLLDAELASSGRVRKVRTERSIQSLFVLRPYAKIRRRWRVTCRKRGEYVLPGVLVTGSDILGIHINSTRLEIDTEAAAREGLHTSVVVLPVPEPLNCLFESSRYLCGDVISNLCPVTDPLRICGSRDYTPLDPMNRISWKSTAAHGHLMVNVEEKTVRHRFSILFNMNSREIELHPDTPSDPAAVEKNIIGCTSVLDRIAAEDVPVKLFVNAPPDKVENCLSPVSLDNDDEDGRKISVCGAFRGSMDMIYALRALAKLPMSISVPAERMFDHVASHPELYSENENLIVISPYIDGRMLNLREVMRSLGVRVTYLITTSRNVAGNLADDPDVYFSLT